MRLQLLFILLVSLVTACGTGGNNNDDDLPTATPAVTPTTIAVAQPSPIPTGGSEPSDVNTLVLWWPDVLAPGDRPEVNIVLNQQVNSFAEEENLEFDFRLKQYGVESGSLMPTLRAASGVAPGAMPDVTLIRRSDLIAAVEDGVIHPLDGLMSAVMIGDLYDPAVQMGQVDGILYGLPYLLDVQHLAYHAEGVPDVWSFDGILENEIPWVFPARRANGLNSTVYAQYIAAGGTSPNSNGEFTLNEDAFLTVLNYYQQARTADLIDEAILDYGIAEDYLTDFSIGVVDTALVSSNVYLEERVGAREWQPASIPTAEGETIGILNGWMWVITTNNVAQQELAARFINWMMAAQRQQSFVDVIHMLPSQRSVVQRLDDSSFAVDFYDTILQSAVLPPPETFNTATARAMQDAFARVVTGDATAEEAMQDLTALAGQP